jgi:hypothetical protein
MIRYVPTSGGPVAEKLTRALWQLGVPPQHQQNRCTTGLFAIRKMTDGSTWLAVETTRSVKVHAEAQIGDIAEVLQPWIDGGQLPTDTLAQLSTLVEGSKGGTLNLWQAFPQLFKDQSKTEEELVTLGLITTSFP